MCVSCQPPCLPDCARSMTNCWLKARESFDDLEIVQRELERLERALPGDRAVQPGLRPVRPGRRPGACRAGRRGAASSRGGRDGDRRGDRRPQRGRGGAVAATAALDAANADATRHRGERDTLHRSAAYQAVGQLEDLRQHVASAAAEIARAGEAARKAAQAAADAGRELDEAQRSVAADLAEVATCFERIRASARWRPSPTDSPRSTSSSAPERPT